MGEDRQVEREDALAEGQSSVPLGKLFITVFFLTLAGSGRDRASEYFLLDKWVLIL